MNPSIWARNTARRSFPDKGMSSYDITRGMRMHAAEQRQSSNREAWSGGVWQPGAPTHTTMGIASSILPKITLDGSNG